jgi:hypothetical protein
VTNPLSTQILIRALLSRFEGCRVSRIIAAATACVISLYAQAQAQDVRRAPLFGTLRLASGFAPDPHVTAFTVGEGAVEASSLAPSCVGQITEAPTIVLRFDSGGGLDLIMRVWSEADTTLVIRAPDGRWHCDDDGAATGFDPQVRFPAPSSGPYYVWVGTYAADAGQAPARLHISEVSSR